MQKGEETKTVEQLLAEADELIHQINSMALEDMEEEHRILFEKHTQNIINVKATLQEKTGDQGKWEIGSSLNGIDAALEDIVRATRDLKKYLGI